jgi:hypothetical protein
MAAFSIAHGREDEHAAELKRGLSRMPSGFVAQVCWACDGRGARRQTYTAGCGGGYYSAMGGCDFCDGTGLMQGAKPAPASVRAQLLIAAANEGAS